MSGFVGVFMGVLWNCVEFLKIVSLDFCKMFVGPLLCVV